MSPTEHRHIDLPPHLRVSTFRRALLRGLGVVLPPLLTVVVLIWAWNAIESYILRPMESGARQVLVWTISDTKRSRPPEAELIDEAVPAQGFVYQGQRYIADPTGHRYLPEYVVRYVDNNLDVLGPYQSLPSTANAYWHRYIELQYLPRRFIVPLFLLVFLTVLYVLGRVFGHGIGRWIVNSLESGINRVPIVNKVYGSVKQVTDFAFSEREIEFNRVVAIEYPREGIWSIGFVTGNGLPEIARAAGEPVLSVLMPTSPMPMTGFTVTVRRSEAIDLDLTIDEAIQFCISCGVVLPPPRLISAPPAVSAPQAAPSGVSLISVPARIYSKTFLRSIFSFQGRGTM
jgi:uncharacterized membrane protein